MNKLVDKISGSRITANLIDNRPVIKVNITGSGPRGAGGLSAYDIWIKEGNEGGYTEFLESLKGAPGLPGKDGEYGGTGGDGSYVHPKTHSAEMIVETAERVFITASEKELVLKGLVFDQISAVKEWVINHNLGKFPIITVVDTGGNVVQGDIKYTSENQIVITFTSEFSGQVYLN